MIKENMNKKACAYKEIYEILKIFPAELVNMIPEDKILIFLQNMDKNYQFNISPETFGTKEMLPETVALLTLLFQDYWSTPEQKRKLLRYEEEVRDYVYKENSEKYNPDNLFK